MKKFFNDKDGFNKALVALVIPIAIQRLITALVSSVDVMMLSSISQEAMSAVSQAGQITFFLNIFYIGLSSGAGVLAAQYWGKRDVKTIERVLNISCGFSLIISTLFFFLSIFCPGALVSIFTNDPKLIELGSVYQQWIAPSYLAMALTQMYLTVIKSLENAKFTAWVASSCLILNIIFNSICIFYLFPNNPTLAITGVAISTVAARFIELICCVVHTYVNGLIRFRIPKLDKNLRELFRDFVKYTLPIIGNYIVWGGALVGIAAIIGHVSTDLVAANSVANVVKNLVVVVSAGVAGGGAVLVGKYLGEGNKEMAKKAGDRICIYALVLGFISAGIVLLIKPLVFMFFQINDTATGYLDIMMYVCAAYCIGKSYNSTILGGVFAAGGDAKFSFWCDTIVMWGIMIPVGFICAFVLHLHPVLIYIILNFDEFIKLPVAIIRYKKYRWLNNITRDFN